MNDLFGIQGEVTKRGEDGLEITNTDSLKGRGADQSE
jgi:hypothetical protein